MLLSGVTLTAPGLAPTHNFDGDGKSDILWQHSGGTPATSGTATTVAGGAYSISGLQAGTYSVDFTAPAGFVKTGMTAGLP